MTEQELCDHSYCPNEEDTMAVVTDIKDTHNAAFTGGLRVLADLLDETRAAKPYDDYRHLICVSTREELVDVVRTFGGRWMKNEEPGDYFGVTRELGGGVTVYVYAPRKAVCEPVVVGKRKVQRPATEDEVRAAQQHEDVIKDVQMIPMVEEEQDVVEWRCPPGLLAEATA